MAGIIYPNIEARREDLGVTKQRMSEKLGLSVSGLQKKLDGRSEFSAREVRTLAEWWGTSADELLREVVETAELVR